jgi:soluble lytic murein transglycosylase
MSTRTATTSRARRAGSTSSTATRRRQARARRRRLLAILVVGALAAAGGYLLLQPAFHHAVQEIALPLRHEDIIRQQAADKGIDPALIAGVIYAESRFIDGRTSSAGAEGLMQLTPRTAKDIAHKSGGTQFHVSDLGTPQVNIAYGAWYLRYLMQRYAGNETFALAAYNGGEGNVDRWIAAAEKRNEALTIAAIPFSETRTYVQRVQDAKRQYRRSYARELGL